MFKLLKLLLNEQGTTLAITRVVAGTAATATAMGARDAEIEAVVNGAIDGDNIADDGVAAAKLASDVIRANYGLVQHTDGSLYVDVSDTNPSLEISDGGVRVKVDDSTIERASGGLQVKDDGITAAKLDSAALAAAWPIGSVFISVVSTDPSTLLGFGTWSAFAAGKVLVGLNSGDSDFDTAEETGGSKTHTLTTAEMPAHTHQVPGKLGGTGSTAANFLRADTQEDDGDIASESAGSGSAHSIVQPYIVCYMWKRTA